MKPPSHQETAHSEREAYEPPTDDNTGIGGDPANLLTRCHQLLAPGGSALIELDPPGKTLRHEHVRLNGTSTWTANTGNRWFAEPERP